MGGDEGSVPSVSVSALDLGTSATIARVEGDLRAFGKHFESQFVQKTLSQSTLTGAEDRREAYGDVGRVLRNRCDDRPKHHKINEERNQEVESNDQKAVMYPCARKGRGRPGQGKASLATGSRQD